MDYLPFRVLIGPSPGQWSFSYYFDDSYNFREYPHLLSLAPWTLQHITEVLTHRGINVYEPVSNVFKAVEVGGVCGLDTRCLRLVTLALHTANALLLMEWLRLFGGEPSTWRIRALSTLVCYFWWVHPLNMEVIGWLSAQGYALALLQALLSSVALERAIRVAKTDGQKPPRLWTLPLLLVASVALYVSACLTKPPVVTLTLVHLLRLALEFSAPAICSARTSRFLYLLFPASLVASAAAMLAVIFHSNADNVAAYKQPRSPAGLFMALVKAAHTVSAFAGRTLYPVDLRVHYLVPDVFLGHCPDLECAHAALLSPEGAAILLSCCVLCLAAAGMLCTGRQVAFGVLAWACLWAPAAGIFPHGWTALGGDRYAYMPNAYLSAALVAGLDMLVGRAGGAEKEEEEKEKDGRKPAWRWVPLRLVVLVCLGLPYVGLLGGLSAAGLSKWRSDLPLLNDCVAKDAGETLCLELLAEFHGHHLGDDERGVHYRTLLLRHLRLHDVKDHLFKARVLLLMGRQEDCCKALEAAVLLYSPASIAPAEHAAMLLNNFLICQSLLLLRRPAEGGSDGQGDPQPSKAALEVHLGQIAALLPRLEGDSSLRSLLQDHDRRLAAVVQGGALEPFQGTFAW